MVKELQFRKLRADEIQVRPTDTKYKGKCRLLLYQDARVPIDILNETVGQMNWQCDYKEVNGVVYCGIAINNDGEWIWKWDCGSESNIEAEKGQSSDAMKRAAVKWGIGRELYSTPKIDIKCPDSYYYNDKFCMSFSVNMIEWDGNELKALEVVDKFGNPVFGTYTEEIFKQKQRNAEVLKEFCTQKKNEGADTTQLKRFYDYYLPKADTWSGEFKVDLLWDKHLNKKV